MPPTTQMFRKAALDAIGGRKLIVSANGAEPTIGQSGHFADDTGTLQAVKVKGIDAQGVITLQLHDGTTVKSHPTLEPDGDVPVLCHHRLALD